MEVRTLLIGLGGTGCKIVDRVAGMINENFIPDRRICCIGFDTDSNDIGNIKHIEIIPTSKEQIVDEYLKKTVGWEEWFPDSPYIKYRSMIDGAGQMRPLSRLAFIESKSRFGKLIDAIRSLNLARGEVTPSNLRVMIVSSFAGGTGSGMFLHMALWLRRYFQENYGATILIRGLFAFPDIYMASTDDAVQRQSKYANAYAAIRELNAINRVTLGIAPKDSIKMTLEDQFDSQRDFGRAELKPFDLMFFIDKLNLARRELPSLEHYTQLMTNITYMQVYSPLIQNQYTVEDNRFINIMMSEGEAIYGSAGTASLEYPYEDIVKYCGLRATSDSISSTWSLFDEEFRNALRENTTIRRNDPSIPALNRDDHYINHVQELLDADRGAFGFIRNDVMETMNNAYLRREELYFSRIKSLLERSISTNQKTEDARINCEVNREMLNDTNQIFDHVGAIEAGLRNYREIIDQEINLMRSPLYQAIISDSPDNIQFFRNGDFSIMTLLLRGKDYVHPLSARFLLYRLRKLMQDEYQKAESSLNYCLQQMSSYHDKDWDLQTKDVKESATEMADKVAGRPFSGLPDWLFRDGKYKKFRDAYFHDAKEHRDILDDYFDASLKKAVFSETLSRLTILIGKYESFFDSLPNIQGTLDSEIRSLEIKHEVETDISTYINASAQAKRDTYEELNISVAAEGISQVSGAILDALYNISCEEIERKRLNRREQRTEEERLANEQRRMSSIFRSSVVGFITQQVRMEKSDFLDINAYDALKKHCYVNDDDLGPADKRRKYQQLLAQVAIKGSPYLLYNTQGTINANDQASQREISPNFTYSHVFWGINDQVKESIEHDNPDIGLDIASFFGTTAEGFAPMVNPTRHFSRYRIEFYQSSYGIALKDIAKFSETAEETGVFYREYKNRLDAMRQGRSDAITPHLNVNWHLPQYLPHINMSKDEADEKRLAEAFWLALAYGKITLAVSERGELRYYSTLMGNSEQLRWGKEYLRAEHVYQVLVKLKNDETAILKACELRKLLFEDEIRKIREGSLTQKKFISGLISSDQKDQNAIRILSYIGADTSEQNYEHLQKTIFELKTALEALIEEFCAKLSNDDTIVQEAIRDIKRSILDASEIDYNRGENLIFKDWA